MSLLNELLPYLNTIFPIAITAIGALGPLISLLRNASKLEKSQDKITTTPTQPSISPQINASIHKKPQDIAITIDSVPATTSTQASAPAQTAEQAATPTQISAPAQTAEQAATPIQISASKNASKDIFQTIESQLEQLSEYYTMNKKQANYSFSASISAIVLGFIILAFGIWLFYSNTSSNLPGTALAGVGGILLQFIGGSYFFMYRTSLKQVNYFFSKLVIMQDTMLTIKLAKDLPNEGKPNEKKQIELTEKIIITLLARSSNPDQGLMSLINESIEMKTQNASNNHAQTRRSRKSTDPKSVQATNGNQHIS